MLGAAFGWIIRFARLTAQAANTLLHFPNSPNSDWLWLMHWPECFVVLPCSTMAMRNVSNFVLVLSVMIASIGWLYCTLRQSYI